MVSSDRKMAKIVLALDSLVSTRDIGRHKISIPLKFVKLLESVE